MISIVDYGLGNVAAFQNLFGRINVESCIAQHPDKLKSAKKIILPGVGAFDHAMDLLDKSGLRPTLEELVVHAKIPVLGVCVGMQILADSSEEGTAAGLGWVKGRVVRHRLSETVRLPLPHMGWNDIAPTPGSRLFDGLGELRFYFLHSFVVQCEDEADVAARCDYSPPFTCAVERGNVFGVQFHPEKSHTFGVALLRRFAEL